MSTRSSASRLLAIVAAGVLAGPGVPAVAHAVTFGGLAGSTGTTFVTYAEEGVTVQSQFGPWKESHEVGALQPSIYIQVLPDDNNFGSLDVTAGGALFTFQSVDLRALGAGIHYQIGGSREGEYLFSFSDSQLASPDFQTVLSTSSALIDMLRIDISLGGEGTFHVDNVKVQVVPEPGAPALLGAGLGVLVLLHRRRGPRSWRGGRRLMRPQATAGRRSSSLSSVMG